MTNLFNTAYANTLPLINAANTAKKDNCYHNNTVKPGANMPANTPTNTYPAAPAEPTVAEQQAPALGQDTVNIAGDKQDTSLNTYKPFGRYGKGAHQLAASLGVDVSELQNALFEISGRYERKVADTLFTKLFGATKQSSFDLSTSFMKLFKGGVNLNNEVLNRMHSQLSAIDGRTSAYMSVSRISETSISQSMSFSAKGLVQTSDGHIINIDMQLNMSSSFYQRIEERYQIATNSEEGIKLRADEISKALRDPLVISFDAPAAALGKTKFTFDLDCDGTADQISTLAKGCGFLALDKNGDGVINDGTELFGAKTGDGFAELAVYDSDGNGWLDENDPIFKELRVWSVEDDGTRRLMSLGELGIGAIYLGSSKGDYRLGNLSNPDALIRSTGIFLREDYTGGIIQHVDFKL